MVWILKLLFMHVAMVALLVGMQCLPKGCDRLQMGINTH